MQWPDRWFLCRQLGCAESKALRKLPSLAWVRSRLQQSQRDAGFMFHLRQVLYEFGLSRVHSMTHDDVVQQIARLMANGELHVHSLADIPAVRSKGHGASEAADVRIEPPGPQPPVAARIEAVSPTELEGVSIPADVHSERQAAVLVFAARYGEPLVPRCTLR